MLSGEKVKRVEANEKQLIMESRRMVEYDSLLIATGGVPRTLNLPGSDLSNIFVLRDFASADTIIAAAENAQNVAVIGASFIGMEVAFSLMKRGKEVTVIAPDKVPFERTLGAEVGALLKRSTKRTA